MTWTPKQLTRTQLEERRREGAQLIRRGSLSYSAIARRLGVSRAAVSQWAARLDSGGLRALRNRAITGRPARLRAQDSKQLRRLLRRGAASAGFPTEQWTLSRIRRLIEREFGVSYHPCYLSRWLRSHGWSVQRPVPRAAERDEQLIRAWLAQDWPRIKKSAAALRRHHLL
jgi:putative transposase